MMDLRGQAEEIADYLETLERNRDALRTFQQLISSADPGVRATLEAITDALDHNLTNAEIKLAELRENLPE